MMVLNIGIVFELVGLSVRATTLLMLWHVHMCFVFKIALVMVWACLNGLLELGRFDRLRCFVACPRESVCLLLHSDGLFLGCGEVVCKCGSLSVVTMGARVFFYDCVGCGRCMPAHFASKFVVFVGRWVLIGGVFLLGINRGGVCRLVHDDCFELCGICLVHESFMTLVWHPC